MTHTAILLCFIAAALTATASAADTSLPSTNLRTEYKTNPLGLDITNPRFSWLLESTNPDQRNQRQSAYQILVASSKENLTEEKADLWNTGKVASDNTNQIVYSGKPLASRQQCYWTVKTWNESDHPSDFAPAAHFTIGLLDKKDWSAEWIGYDADDTSKDGKLTGDVTVNLDAANWIWTNQPATRPATGAAATQPAKDEAFFRRAIDIPANRTIRAATLVITADNKFDIYINGGKAAEGNDFHNAYSSQVTNQLRPGRNQLAIRVLNEGGPAGVVARLRIDFTDGADPLIVETDQSWKTARTVKRSWRKDDYDDKNWLPANIVAKVGDQPWGTPTRKELILPPPPTLRKTFTTDKPIKRATLYATALGLYEMHLNGKRIGDLELTPGWTDYHKRVYYNTYDVTPTLSPGTNVVVAILADGWYDGYLGYTFKRHNYNGNPRLRAQLELEFEDGSKQTINTDNTWKAAYGPLREADLLMGTTLDARRDLGNWTATEYDDSSWHPVTTGGPDNIAIQSHPGDPVKRIQELPAKKLTEPKPGTYVFDLAQNMVGTSRLRLNGTKGKPITIRYAEMLNPDGSLYTVALRAARATDTYIPMGDGTILWEPQFTFHGFRYVEITGLAKPPVLEDVTGLVIHSDITPTGTFTCSDPLINQLVHNIQWGQQGNYLEIPTDCPQRDERLGWTGDAQFFIRTGTYNFDVAPFFTKWLVDLIDDSQMKSGGFTHVAPALDPNDGGGTAWQDAAPICTWTIYRQYNDTRIIQQHYKSLQRYMDYLHDTSKDYIRNDKPFGDWLNLQAPTKSEVIGTAYYAYVADLMSQMAAAIGKTEDAKTYADLHDKIKTAFIKNFLTEDGRIKDSSQTGYALAFTMNLIPPEHRAKCANHFIQTIKDKNYHLATGFIGTPRLLPALQEAGKPDIAYRLLENKDFPSWLYPVTLGATTMWERWDGYRPDKGFQDPAMNSFNHYAFGSVGQWLYESIAGIQPAAPGFKKIQLTPTPGGSLTSARAEYLSINGKITSAWKKTDAGIEYDFTIPPNTTAEMSVPTRDADLITEGTDNSLPATTTLKLLRRTATSATFELSSGHYHFHVPAGFLPTDD